MFTRILLVEIQIILTFVFILVIWNTPGILAYAASASSSEDCPPFAIKEECGYEAWIHLTESLVIGAFLGLLFHHLAHKQNIKLEKIIREQEAMRRRRKEYAFQELKNHFTSLVFALSLSDRLVSAYSSSNIIDSNKKEYMRSQIHKNDEKIKRIAGEVRNVTLFSNDVIEPKTVNEINDVCKDIQDSVIEENGIVKYQIFSDLKKKILDLSTRIDEQYKSDVSIRDLFKDQNEKV